MKTERQIFLMALLGTAMAAIAQVQIPGEQPGGWSGEPNFGEMNGQSMRGTLRQPFTGGMTMPAWMYGEVAPHGVPAHHPTQPPFIPGYRRVNMQTGEEGEGFFTTVYADPGPAPANPFESPYGGYDPSQYTPEGFEPNADPFASPYGSMDPSQYTPEGFEPNEDPFSDPYGGMDPSGFAPNEDPFSDPYGGMMDPSMYEDPGAGANEDPYSNPYGGADPSSMYGDPYGGGMDPSMYEDPGNFLGGGYPDGH